MKHLLAGTVVLLALSGSAEARRRDPSAAAARPDRGKQTEAQRKARARKLVEEARVQFDSGNFPVAAARFEEAYRLFPVAKMLYNIGITWEALKKNDRALCALEGFLAEVRDADPQVLAESQEKVEKLKPTVGRVEVEAPAGAALFIDGDERAVAPAPRALCVAEGKRRVVALVAGSAPVGIDLDVKGGGVIKVSLDPAKNTARLVGAPAEPVPVAVPATPAPADPQPEAQPLWKKWWLWTAVGAVVVGGIAIGVGVGARPTHVEAPPSTLGAFEVFR